MNYYNEWDSFAAEWLKQLIKDGLIPDGEVDTRSIADVEPSDLQGFTQCHFFAGIGGWSRALQLAGWSSDRPVWTGSPPCQSFSTAGKGKGKDDERHLWPVFFNLIRECQPTAVFGEQVAAAIRHGWLDDLQIDFEAEGYASAAVVLPSGGIGAYHKRDRLFFTAKRVANTDEFGQSRPGEVQRRFGTEKDSQGEVNRVVDVSGVSASLANTNSSQLQGRGIPGGVDQKDSATRGDEAFSLWGNSQIIYCRDGKYRAIPTEPEVFPLANGIPNRVGILRGAGNAIVPQAAAEIIKAVM
jgi:DNA (cytosine-5)-methyltransferase 1